jgi:hypothetical protein
MISADETAARSRLRISSVVMRMRLFVRAVNNAAGIPLPETSPKKYKTIHPRW